MITAHLRQSVGICLPPIFKLFAADLKLSCKDHRLPRLHYLKHIYSDLTYDARIAFIMQLIMCLRHF